MKYKYRSGKKRSRRGMHDLVERMVKFEVECDLLTQETPEDARRFWIGLLLAIGADRRGKRRNQLIVTEVK